jgi:hypothetical protein
VRRFAVRRRPLLRLKGALLSSPVRGREGVAHRGCPSVAGWAPSTVATPKASAAINLAVLGRVPSSVQMWVGVLVGRRCECAGSPAPSELGTGVRGPSTPMSSQQNRGRCLQAGRRPLGNCRAWLPTGATGRSSVNRGQPVEGYPRRRHRQRGRCCPIQSVANSTGPWPPTVPFRWPTGWLTGTQATTPPTCRPGTDWSTCSDVPTSCTSHPGGPSCTARTCTCGLEEWAARFD